MNEDQEMKKRRVDGEIKEDEKPRDLGELLKGYQLATNELLQVIVVMFKRLEELENKN